jgi:hypothetical protein
MDTIFIVLLVIVLITFALVYMCAYKMSITNGGNDDSDDKMNDKMEPNEINPIISKIYKTKQVELLDGKTIPLRANVHDKEGLLIYTLVKKYKLRRCMEIGFAMGLSALHICQAFADLSDKMDKSDKMELISIDPFQDKNWKCAGIANIKNAGFEKYHTWIKDKSYSASAARGPMVLHFFCRIVPRNIEGKFL